MAARQNMTPDEYRINMVELIEPEIWRTPGGTWVCRIIDADGKECRVQGTDWRNAVDNLLEECGYERA